MLLLQLGQFPDVMTFAGVKDEQETGQSREGKRPKTKHARKE